MVTKWMRIQDSNSLSRKKERTANEARKRKKEIQGQDKEQISFKTKT